MKLQISLSLMLLFCIGLKAQQSKSPRTTYNFNPDWKLAVGDTSAAEKPDFPDSKWKEITLPHAWNEDEAFKKSIEQLSTGICWYRKHFKIPPADSAKKVFIEFEGARQGAEFYLNGQFLGRHENGITAAGFDLTPFLKPNGTDNVIAVRTDNAWNYKEKSTGSGYQWSDKNFNANYGGLPKNVRLHVTGKIYQTLPLYSTLKTTGVYVYASDFNIPERTALIHCKSELKNESDYAQNLQYEVEILDMEGKSIKTFSGNTINLKAGATAVLEAESAVGNLNFWSWGYGYLYTVISRLKDGTEVLDEVKTKTGFRKGEYKNGMVYLNDQVLMMKGYAQRSSNEWPAMGLSVPPWMSDYSNGLMVESGANLVRWMHITPWKQDIESCDRVGLIQAMPAGDAEKDVQGVRWEHRKSVMRDAMVYNRNNPSILFYECGNESISAEHMAEMKALSDEFDPFGWRAIGSREMLDIDAAEYGGEMLYVNKSGGKPLWSMEYSRDEGLRKYWDEFSPPYHKEGAGPLYKGADASAYNHNQDKHALESVARWNDYYVDRPGTGDRVSSGGVNIIFSDSNTHYRGEENYRRSGEVDAMRIPKDGFFAHKVIWDGWVEPKKTGIHLIGHWNYKPGVKKDVYVVATGDKVELQLNGKSLGYGKRSEGFNYTFKDVIWKAGVLKAISYDVQGKKLAETSLSTAAAAFAIRLKLIKSNAALKADGADAIIAEVEVVDKNGKRCPTALDMINFELSGPAEWRGGIAQGPDNYILSKSLPVECGVNRVIIRSSTSPGKIVLKANAAGLKSAELSFQSVPFVKENGLATTLPDAGLKSSLLRGPSPGTQTYTVTRKSVKVQSATAGANQDQAKQSHDDNELTAWSNDGQLSTAWIKYELVKESLVSAVAMKLNGFRSKSYPIRILVGEQEVFRGNTTPGLGYFTTDVKPAKGKSLTIQLTGTGSDQQAGPTGTEMNGKKLDDGVEIKGARGKGILSVIEMDVFEKP